MKIFLRGRQKPGGREVEVEYGKSQPLVVTFTAAEVAARYDAGAGGSMMEIPGLTSGKWFTGVITTSNDCDTAQLSDIVAYDPDASTSDINDNGEFMAALAIGEPTVGTYQQNHGDGTRIGTALPGKAIYAFLTCLGPPEFGSITLRVLQFS